MLSTILLLGFAAGVQHAFEADHLAAVSVLTNGEKGLGRVTRHGAFWGLGHTLALLVASALVLFSPWALPARLAPAAELAAGLLLVALGGRLLYRLWRERPGRPHPGEEGDPAPPPAGGRTLLVGLLHGAAGSAALTVYVVAGLESPAVGVVYVLLFGLGSILGMAALSAAIALPLSATARRLDRANLALRAAIALASIGIGLRLALAVGSSLWP